MGNKTKAAERTLRRKINEFAQLGRDINRELFRACSGSADELKVVLPRATRIVRQAQRRLAAL